MEVKADETRVRRSQLAAEHEAWTRVLYQTDPMPTDETLSQARKELDRIGKAIAAEYEGDPSQVLKAGDPAIAEYPEHAPKGK